MRVTANLKRLVDTNGLLNKKHLLKKTEYIIINNKEDYLPSES